VKKKKYPFIPLSKKGIVSIFSAAMLISAPLAGPSITMAEGNGTDKVIFDENLEWMKSKTAMTGKTLTIDFSEQFAAMGANTELEAMSDKQSVQAVFDKKVLTLTIKDFGETTISVTAKNSKQTVTNTFKVNITKKGDINGDGMITPADSLYIYQVISGKVKVTAEQQKLLDINGDGKITNLDATVLMSSYVGKNIPASIEDNSFIQLTDINDTPVAADDTFTINEDEQLKLSKEAGVLANDMDPENQTLTATVTTIPENGQLTFNKDGSFQYVPSANFVGIDRFTYKVSDGSSTTEVKTVTINVLPVNDAPVSKDGVLNTQEDTIGIGTLLGEDVDGDTLTYTVVENGKKGKVTILDQKTGVFSYKPNVNDNGVDTFTYKVSDGKSTSTSTVSVFIKAVNDAPIAKGDSYSTKEDETLTAGKEKNVLLNDDDVDNDSLKAVLVKGTAHGALDFKADGTFTYIPAQDFNGNDSFVYKATDGVLESAEQTVVISVGAVNDTPVAKDSSMNVTEDVAANGAVEASDADKDNLTFAIAENGQKGKAVLTDAQTGKFTYTPDKNINGEDKVVFTVTDGQGEPVKATVSISIMAVNDSPSAVKESFTTNEDEKLTAGIAKGILNNDNDADNDNLEAILEKTTAHGKLELNADGTFTYTPDKDFNGQDFFTYKATDGKLESAEQTVVIEVNAVNDTPVAKDSSLNVTEDQSADGIVEANDVDKDKLTFGIAENGQKGKVILTDTETGKFTYTPDKNANGEDKVVFTVTDGLSEPVKTTVSIFIKAVNDAPSAAKDSFTVKEDEKLVVVEEKSILANDEDIDNDKLQVILVKDTAHGKLELNADGTFAYTPNKDYTGKDSFTYKATDGKLESAEQTVEMEVRAVNDTPTANASSIELEEDGNVDGKLTGSDPEGDSLTYSIGKNGSKGTAVITNEHTGAFTYTPNKDANGADSFTFKVNDGNADSEAATVSVTIKSVNDAPTASDVKVEGTARVGETLTGTYIYNDVENDAEEQSTFQWYSGDNEDGSDKTKIDGATSKEYQVTNDDLKKYVFFEVKPAAATGEQATESYLSNASEKVKLADSVAPTIVSTTPENFASEVGISDDLVITMSENILAGTGKIMILNSDSSKFAEYQTNDTQHVIIDGTKVTIKHADFEVGKAYSIVVGSDAFIDEAENAYQYNNYKWIFETAAAPAITIYADEYTPLEEETMEQNFGAFIYVDIKGDKFKDLTFDDVVLNNAPESVSIAGIYLEDNKVTLALTYDGSDFDTKFSDFTVTVKGSGLVKGTDLTSNSLEIVPSADPQTPFISEYLHGEGGRSAIEIYNPQQVVGNYKLKVYTLANGVKQTMEMPVNFNEYTRYSPFLIINSIFYDAMDIMNIWYYNEELFFDKDSSIVNAIQLIDPSGNVIDTVGDPSLSTSIISENATMVRNAGINDGIDRYVPSQWKIDTASIYTHFGNRN